MRGSDFPADTAMAKAWGGIGNILVELGRRKQAADDALATSEAAQLRDLADNQMQLYMETESDPDKWGPQWSKILGQVDKKHAKLKFSNNVRERESLRQAAFRESSELKLQIDVTRQTVENAVIDTGRNYQIAFESGDEMKIAEAKTAYSDALNLRYAPKIAKIHLDKATAEGMKAYWLEQAKKYPDQTIADMDEKMKSLRKGGKDAFGLKVTDYSDIRRSAGIELNRSIAVSKQALELQQEEANKSLTDLYANHQLAMSDIEQYREIFDSADYQTWVTRLDLQMKRLAEDKPIATDYAEVSRLEIMANGVWAGRFSPKDVRAKLLDAYCGYKDEKGKIHDAVIDATEFKRLSSLVTTKTEANQAAALARADVEAGRQLVTYRDEGGFSIAIQGKDVKIQKRMTDERQLQFWHLAQYNKSMRKWIEDNPNKLGKDFYQYAESQLYGQWNLSVEELRERRQKAKPKPPGVFKYTATNPTTGERLGSNDKKTWQPIP